MQIWDTCGLEEFSACTPSLYRDSSLAIIVYAIDDKKSFEDVENWVNLVKINAKPETLLYIVGNKNDLENERQVKKEEGEEFAKKNNFNFFIETSAKDNNFVSELFQQGLIQFYEQYEDHIKNCENNESFERIDFRRKDSVKIKNTNFPIKKEEEKGCCKVIF